MRSGSSPRTTTPRGPVGTFRSVRPARRIAAHDAALAVALTIAGELEILLAASGDGSRLVSALALPFLTLPLAWRRRFPLLPLVACAVVLPAQGTLDGVLVGHVVTPLIALLVALYGGGRRVDTVGGLAVLAASVVAVTGARVVFDPGVERPADAALTFVAVCLPILVGRWVRGQAQLQEGLRERYRRLVRDRDRDVRQAAEEERIRIATDLQAAIAGGLRRITRQANELPARLAVGDHAAAHALLGGIATTARDALADVRRVLGILRRDDDGPAPRAPHDPDPLARVREDAPELASAAPPPRRRGLPGVIADRALASAVLLGGAAELAVTDGAAAALTAVPVALPLLWRRRAPVAVALLVLAAIALQSLLLDLSAFPLADMAAVVCAAYAVGAHAGRRASILGLALTSAAAGAHAAIFYPDGVIAALLGGVAAPWTVGRVVRSHRLLTGQRREAAEVAEQARAREARAAVTAERMRIARELHDAVAHNISVIAIQAGGAEGIVERDADRAARIAELIEAVAREAAGELDRLRGRAAHDRRCGGAESRAGRRARVSARGMRACRWSCTSRARRPRSPWASTSRPTGSSRRRWQTPRSTPVTRGRRSRSATSASRSRSRSRTTGAAPAEPRRRPAADTVSSACASASASTAARSTSGRARTAASASAHACRWAARDASASCIADDQSLVRAGFRLRAREPRGHRGRGRGVQRRTRRSTARGASSPTSCSWTSACRSSTGSPRRAHHRRRRRPRGCSSSRPTTSTSTCTTRCRPGRAGSC